MALDEGLGAEQAALLGAVEQHDDVVAEGRALGQRPSGLEECCGGDAGITGAGSRGHAVVVGVHEHGVVGVAASFEARQHVRHRRGLVDGRHLELHVVPEVDQRRSDVLTDVRDLERGDRMRRPGDRDEVVPGSAGRELVGRRALGFRRRCAEVDHDECRHGDDRDPDDQLPGTLGDASIRYRGFMTANPVVLDTDAGIARLTLNRPDAANAIDLEMASALHEAATTLAGDDRPARRVAARRGARFCGGGDVHAFAGAGDQLDRRLGEIVTQLHHAVETLAALDAPVVAAVQGSAAGAGFALAMGADLVVAAESTKFVVAYTGIGLSPDGGTTWYLERIVGRQRALELVLTNRVLTASEAHDWGLVTRVVADDDLESESEALVAEFAVGPTQAFGAAKRLVRFAPGSDLHDQLADEATQLMRAGASDDGREGVAAFVEKRRPTFGGR